MSAHTPATFYEILRHQVEADGDAVAVQGLDALDLTYRELAAQIDKVIAAFSAWGIGHGDLVMIQLPNGPEAFVALQSVSAVAVAVMIDPQAGEAQIDYLLDFIRPKVMVLQQSIEGPGRERARAFGAQIVDLIPTPQSGAGTFDFAQGYEPLTSAPHLNGPDDLSYLIPTSGTTALPKLIPKTQRTLLRGIEDLLDLQANVVGKSLPLVTLNLLPMHLGYAIWGGIGALLTGGRVACMPNLNLDHWYEWLDRYRPTFWSGPPAILDSLLATAPQYADILSRHSLRYINVGSATLADETRAGINGYFNVPIVQTYGLAEVGIVSELILPAGSTEPLTTLGQPKYPERTRIMSFDGSFLPAGEPGEVVIDSDDFDGYWNNPEANGDAFRDGWFRTGDEGVIDRDGNIALLGRLKEVINSGGAKVSPNEVEAVLMQHPQVKAAAVFGLKNADMGETVAAAVVGDVTERALRKFAAERLPFFKVPTRIVVVDAIPLSAGGKVPRNRLAELLGLN